MKKLWNTINSNKYSMIFNIIIIALTYITWSIIYYYNIPVISYLIMTYCFYIIKDINHVKIVNCLVEILLEYCSLNIELYNANIIQENDSSEIVNHKTKVKDIIIDGTKKINDMVDNHATS